MTLTLKLVSSRPEPVTRIRKAWLEDSSLHSSHIPEFFFIKESMTVRVVQRYIDKEKRKYEWVADIEFDDMRMLAKEAHQAYYAGKYRVIKEHL